jgi:alkylresorcinol/alkylpyrone synthase
MAEQHSVYMTKGLPLLIDAAGKALEAAGLSSDQVNHVIFVSTTGLSAPSLDAHLINSIGFSRNVTRLPIWGLGCGAGVSGLARAFDHCLAHPDAIVLLTALETCTINFVPGDDTRRNLIAMSLFSDCCAAVVVVGDHVEHTLTARPKILATWSDLAPGTTDIAGWDITEKGFQLVLSPELPKIAQQELRRILETFLEKQKIELGSIVHYLFHPGSAKVLDVIQDTLELSRESLQFSERVMSEFGNISSVTVLVVLEKWLADPVSRKPGYGILGAFGPGYSTELVLVEI